MIFPSRNGNCLGVSAPMRVPRPAAGRMATMRLMFVTRSTSSGIDDSRLARAYAFCEQTSVQQPALEAKSSRPTIRNVVLFCVAMVAAVLDSVLVAVARF